MTSALPAPDAPSPALPDAPAVEAWRAFLRAHSLVVRRLETELLAAADLPLAWYDVLVQLSEAPGRRLRMTQLADRVLLSRSGLTRLVDRLEREGLVQREACPDDARGTFTVLSDAGVERLREAAPAHLAGVAAHVTSHLSAEELDVLRGLLSRIVEANGGDPRAVPGCGGPGC